MSQPSSSGSPKKQASESQPILPERLDDHPRPANVRHISAPIYHSPIHHHQRRFAPRKQVKETRNAKSQYSNSQDDGSAEHRINQYIIKQEIGRGSFGSVHLATDQYGKEYAVKEFSKSRLRKRAQSNMLRRTQAMKKVMKGPRAPRGFNAPLHHQTASPSPGAMDSLDLIRQEIAIMKKLDHPNVVSLVEVLDDPSEDLLYMVLEMCKKGVSMHVGLDERADPYDNERCRLWFRDMILGLEYLHAQGIIHRDIKPDNCLITNDDVLKIVDFGVSEMFAKDEEMNTKKSAGSPAFMPPELCVAKHGEVSGRACDIWSMGITLYCFAFGHIPFEKSAMLDLYESIKTDKVHVPDTCGPDLKDLLLRLLEKDPHKRIEMDEIREHPWVTKNGADKLLPKDENTVNLIEPPTQEEVNKAITEPMLRMFNVMKAANKFKRLLTRKRPQFMDGPFGESNMLSEPPEEMDPPLARTHSDTLADRKRVEGPLVAKGISRRINVDENLGAIHDKVDKEELHKIEKDLKAPDSRNDPPISNLTTHGLPEAEENGVVSPKSATGRGHAHDPLLDTLFLNIGSSADTPEPLPGSPFVVSESPGAVEINVYERAYEEEIQKILSDKKKGHRPTIYLTKRVEQISRLKNHKDITDFSRDSPSSPQASEPKLGFSTLIDKAKSEIMAEKGKHGSKKHDDEDER